MILYHFTYLHRLKTILAEGLKPAAQSVPPRNCLWFTTEPDPVWWWEGGNKSEVRITVVIPSRDRRLARYEPWLRHKHPELISTVEEVAARTGARWQAWYIYFGAVALNRFRAVEYADPAKRADMLVRT
jgi:hypothetical protein